MKAIYTFLFAGIAVAACKGPVQKAQGPNIGQETVQTVIQPIPGLEIAPTVYKVSATEASTVNLPNGGSIEFPANAFVDAAGNPVKGTVDVNWTEFHTLTDIMLSGIPMKYDSLGKEYDFVSGGMFTIDAVANNEKVELAKDKKATVNLASIDDTPCYNFYKLDTKTGDWDYKLTKNGVPAPKKTLTSVEEDPATKAVPAEEKPFIIDAQVNTSAFPELGNKPIVGWKTTSRIADKQKRLLEKVASSNVLKSGEKPGEYILEVKTGNLTQEFEVKPYLLSEAKADTRKNDVRQEKNYKELLAFQETTNRNAMIRTVEIAGFGTYNWDIIHRREVVKQLAADFIFPSENGEKIDPAAVTLYLISPDEKAVVNYAASDWNKFSFDPRMKNCVVAILPDNSVASIGNEGFAEAGKVPDGNKYSFHLKKTKVVLKSGKDIARYLQELI